MTLPLNKTGFRTFIFVVVTWSFLVSLISSVRAQNQDVDVPFDLSKLIRQMRDDDVPNNATSAYRTLLNARKSLSDEQENIMVKRLQKVIGEGGRQQAMFAGGILRRWEKSRSIRNSSPHLVPVIVRTLLSNAGDTLRYECYNLIRVLTRLRSSGNKIRFSRKRVHSILHQTEWRGTRSRKKETALRIADLLGSNVRSKELTRWIMNNLESDETGNNAHRAFRHLKRMKPDHVRSFLRKGLRSNDYQTRQFSALILLDINKVKPEKRFITTLVDGLQDDHINGLVANAGRFTNALEQIGPPAHTQLEQALSSDDRQQSQLAAWILHQSPEYSPTDRFIRELVDGLRDDSIQGHWAFSNRKRMYEALLDLGERAHPFLLNGIKSDDWQMRLYSARALIKTNHRSYLSQTVPILMNQLKHDGISGNGKKTEWFLEDLEGTHAYPVVTRHLKKLLHNGSPQQCAAAIHILDDEALPDPPRGKTVEKMKSYIPHEETQMDWLISAIQYCGKPVFKEVDGKIRGMLETVFRELHSGKELYTDVMDDVFELYRAKGEQFKYAVLMKFINEHEKLDKDAIHYDPGEYDQTDFAGTPGQFKTWINRPGVVPRDVSKQVERKVRQNVEQLKTRSYTKRTEATRYLLQSDPAIASILLEYYPSKNPEQHQRLKRILSHLLIDRQIERYQNIYRNVTGQQ